MRNRKTLAGALPCILALPMLGCATYRSHVVQLDAHNNVVREWKDVDYFYAAPDGVVSFQDPITGEFITLTGVPVSISTVKVPKQKKEKHK